MGYTHWKKPVGVEGMYVGAKGSEVNIADSSGNLFATSTLSVGGASVVGLQKVNFNLYVNFATAGSAYTTTTAIPIGVAPFAGAVTGYYITSVSAGTGRVFNVESGTTGTVLASNAVSGVTGTVGAILPLVVASPNTVAAGEALWVGCASCATAQTGVFSITVTRTV